MNMNADFGHGLNPGAGVAQQPLIFDDPGVRPTAIPQVTPANIAATGNIGQILANAGTLRAAEANPNPNVIQMLPGVDFQPTTPKLTETVTPSPTVNLAQAEPLESKKLAIEVETKLANLRGALSRFGSDEKYLLTHARETSPKALILRSLFLLPIAFTFIIEAFRRKPSKEAQSNMTNAVKALGELTAVLKKELAESINDNFVRTVLTETEAPVNRNATKAALAVQIKQAYTSPEAAGKELDAFINIATGDWKQQIIDDAFDRLVSERLGLQSAVEAKSTGMGSGEAYRLVSKFMKVQEKLAKESGVFSRFVDPMRGVYDKLVNVFKQSQADMQTKLLAGVQGLSGDLSTAVQQVAKAVGDTAPTVIKQAADAIGEAARKQQAADKATVA